MQGSPVNKRVVERTVSSDCRKLDDCNSKVILVVVFCNVAARDVYVIVISFCLTGLSLVLIVG